MSITSFYKSAVWVLATILAVALFFIVFMIDWLPLPYHMHPERCFSPNRDFYVVRNMSPWRHFFTLLDPEGTAKLYRSDGTLLRKWYTTYGEDSGPYFSYREIAGEMVSNVYFLSEYDHVDVPLPRRPADQPGIYRCDGVLLYPG